jgi:hypothetical protein
MDTTLTMDRQRFDELRRGRPFSAACRRSAAQPSESWSRLEPGKADMKIVLKFLLAFGVVFALITLRAASAYSGWSISLNDGKAR